MKGLNISAILPRKEISLEQLKGKKIAIDSYIMLYQFLLTLPKLTDSKGRITSHLSGLFYRTTHLMRYGIKPAFVFDGLFPVVGEKYKRIINKPVKARITSTITEHVVESSKTLIEAIGLPIIQAPTEGEAQAAYMARKGDVWGVASKDFDCLLFNAPRMIQNLTLAKTRKLPKGGFVYIGIYQCVLKDVLKYLGINHEQFIAMALLIGTDFNPNGVRDIGPKKALQLVKKEKNLDRLFKKVNWQFDFSWKEVYELIKNIPVTNRYRLKWKKPNKKRIKKLLVSEYDFSEKRVDSALKRI